MTPWALGTHHRHPAVDAYEEVKSNAVLDLYTCTGTIHGNYDL